MITRTFLMGLSFLCPFFLCCHDGWAFPVHHELTIDLRPERQELQGHDVVTVEGVEPPIEIELAPHAHVQSVTVNGRSADYRFDSGRMSIASIINDGQEKLVVEVNYSVTFDEPVPMDPVHTEDPSYGVSGTISPEGTFLLAGSGWYPDLSAGSQTFLLTVRGPAGYEAVTAGRRVERKTDTDRSVSVWEIKTDPKGLSLSAGPYVVRERSAEGIPLYTYFFPEDDSLADTYLQAVAGYLRLYNERFGPYPFEKFAVVENFFPTGYGFASYTLLGKTVVRLPFIVETSLGHEVAHSWWGSGVWVDYSQGNWSEGLTSYVADYLYQERASAREAREYRLKILRDYASLVTSENDFPLSAFAGRVSPSTRVVGYGKGAMVFHMARRTVGELSFWQGLRAVYGEKCFQRASWGDFAQALGSAGKKDLKPFFDQWVTRTGGPQLALEDVVSDKTEAGWRVHGRLTQVAPFYSLQVPVRLETERGDMESLVALSGEGVPFSFLSPASPRRLVVDPETDLFRLLEPTEIPAAANSLKGSNQLVAVASRELSPETLKASTLLLEALGHKGAAVYPEDAAGVVATQGAIQGATQGALQGKDVLYLGVPEKGLGLLLPPGFHVSEKNFTVEGKTYDAPEDALFLVSFLPDNKNVVGVFLPLSRKAAEKAVRKIPHYGKYSYLVFQDGTNRIKETWPVTESSLIHVFSEKGATR